MKRILLALTMFGLLLPLVPRADAQNEVSLNFFYDNLSTQGSWIEVADYGYCFQPNVAAENPNWRPYADGYWAYTDAGWTWVSYEDFGWATYHYGRWSHLADYGWVWVPGYEWAPAWVSWRTGGDYVGWAPLPPSADRVYEGRAITGQVDVEFDIGPQYYNFVDVRYIGEPVLRDRIFEPQRNVTIITNTVNVTNITYNNSTVYNYGPDFNRLNQYSTRPIQRLSLQRETTVSADLTGQGGRNRANFSRVNGNQLVVVAPQIQRSEQKFAPKQIKAKVAQPKIEHGWQGVADRTKLQEQMKKENAQTVAPPSFQPQKDRKQEKVAARQGTGANAAAAPSAAQPSAQTPATPNEQQSSQTGKAARKAAKNGRPQPLNTQQAAQPAAGGAGNQPADQTNAQAERMQKAEQQRAGRVRKGKEQRSPQTEPAPATDQGQTSPERNASPPTAEQPERAPSAEQRQTARESQRAGRAPRARPTQEVQPAERAHSAEPAQTAEESQKPERTQRANQEANPQSAQPAERSSQAQPRRPAEQAQPPRRAGAPENPAGPSQGKGKKKKPAEEPSPSP